MNERDSRGLEGVSEQGGTREYPPLYTSEPDQHHNTAGFASADGSGSSAVTDSDGSHGSEPGNGGSDNGSGGDSSIGGSCSSGSNSGSAGRDSRSANGGSDSDSTSGERKRRGRPRGSRNRAAGRNGGAGEAEGYDESDTGSLDDVPGFIGSVPRSDSGKVGRQSNATSYATLWSAVFRAPAFMGLGLHWILQDEEAKELGKATNDLMRTLSKSAQNRLAKAIAKTMPIIGFGLTFGMITLPRVNYTMTLMKAEADRVQGESGNGNSGVGATSVRDFFRR